MTFTKAAHYADEAASRADTAVHLRNNDEPDRAFECLAMAITELSRAVAELARSHGQDGA